MYWTDIFNKRGFSKITRPKTLEVVPKKLLSKNSNKTSRFLLTMFLLSLKYPLKESCYFLFDVKIVLGNFLFLYSAQPKQSILLNKNAQRNVYSIELTNHKEGLVLLYWCFLQTQILFKNPLWECKAQENRLGLTNSICIKAS